ncbi:MAG: SGNH/GDSL hydrolase family protein [Bacteroidia bacterium]
MGKYVNGDTWAETEGVFGCGFNTYRLLDVPVNDTVLPWVCFGYCDSACTPAIGARMACVGNSITFGYGLANPAAESYPSQLQTAVGPGWLVENFGASGTAVIRTAGNPYVRSDPFLHLMRYMPEEVVLMLGINDSKSAIWGPYSGRFYSDYDSLWMAMDTLASAPHIWIGLPTTAFSGLFGIDPGVVNDSIVPQIEMYARVHRQDQIDMHGFTAGLAAGFPDGIHPDSATSGLMAMEILRVMQLPRPLILRNGNQLSATGFGWQWYYNGDTIPTAIGGRDSAIVGNLPGVFQVGVRVDSAFAHVLLSDTVEVQPVGVQEGRSGLRVYPVPVRDVLRVECPGLVDLRGVKLVDAGGKVVCWVNSTDLPMEIDVSKLPAGLYSVCVLADGGEVRRIVKVE